MINNILILFVVTSFAFSEPLFSVLSKQPEFLIAHRLSGRDIVALLGILVFIPALSGALLVRLLRYLSKPLSDAVLYLFVSIPLFLLYLQLFKQLAPLSAPSLITAALGVTIATIYLVVTRVRSPQLLRALTLVALVSPVRFISSDNVWPLIAGEPRGKVMTAEGGTHNRTPVIFLVFDELPLNILLATTQEAPGVALDGVKFPHFSSLAQTSNWYLNATTVNVETSIAVPALLSGKRPQEKIVPPTTHHYPQNLFSLLEPTHAFYTYEKITKLCTQKKCRAGDDNDQHATGIYATLEDLSAVYLHIVVPSDLGIVLPSIDANWSGFWRSATDADARNKGSSQSGIVHDLVNAVPGEAALYYAHMMLPHIPYARFPSGRSYEIDGQFPRGYDNERKVWSTDNEGIIESYQRLLLQAGYADTLLGEIVQVAKSRGIFDEALIVVVADHGVSFESGFHRRGDPASKHFYEEVLSVPLFIKLPHQKTGALFTQNAETVDILPTVSEVVGVPLQGGVDGRSLLTASRNREAPKEITFLPVHGRLKANKVRDGGAEIYQRKVQFEQPLRYPTERIQWRESLFGVSTPLRDVYTRGGADKFVFTPFEVEAISLNPAAVATFSPYLSIITPERFSLSSTQALPAYIRGVLDMPNASLSPPEELLFVLNGQGACRARTYLEDNRVRFSCLIPEELFKHDDNKLEAFFVEQGRYHKITLRSKRAR
jgi:hypothetical protein